MKEWDDKEARKRAKGTEKVGRKAFMQQPLKSPPTNSAATGGAQATTTTTTRNVEDKDDDDDDKNCVEENRSRQPLNDDPALAEAAKEAQTSDNLLLSLTGDNLLDTFGFPSSLPPTNNDRTMRIGQWTASQ